MYLLSGRTFFRRSFRTKLRFTKPRVMFLALSLSLLAIILVRVIRDSASAQSGSDTPNLSANAQQQIKALLDEKARRSPAQQKLDSQLLYAVKMRRGENIAPGVRELNVKIEADAEAKIIVDITAIVGGSLLEDLLANGAELLSVHAQYNSIRARVPLNRLEEIAAFSRVRFIQPKQEPHYLRHIARERENGKLMGDELPLGFSARAGRIRNFLTGTLTGGKTSEGDVTHRAAAARTMFGANGAGVRIGVLADGVTSLAASQASGDLPANVTVLSGYTGAGDEGTAMLEIIHDLAPGAQLFFATAAGGIAGFAQAIRDLRAAGCDIIVDDIIYAVETPFQDGQTPNIISTTNGGIVWQAVNDVTAAGVLYFSAAGNGGNKNDNTSGTWAGDFVDGGTLALVPGGTVHNFGGGTQFDTITVTGLVGSLYWADPLGGSSNDYDLFVLNSTGTAIVASSTNVQNGTQDPFEILVGVDSGNRLVILKKNGAAGRFLYLENLDGQLGINTEGNIRGHAGAAAAYGVAATPAALANGPAPNPTGPFPNPFSATNTVERFSSDGPRRIFFNANGTAITPGNFSATGGTLRQKPDITAADGVAVTGAGGFSARFYGASAAAPHAAAIAAMLKSVNPSLTPSQIRTALTSSAIDIEGAGVDRDSGAGIVMAFQALQTVGAVPAANLQTGTIAAAESSGNNNTFIEPGEAAGLSVQLLNTGPINATGISAVLTTSTPGVVITTGTSTYPNLAATTGAAINTTPFAFNLTTAASCPLRIDFTLTVTFAGGGSPKVLPFSVQAGQPPLAITSTLDATAPNSGPGFTATTGLQNLRLERNGVFTTCNSQKTCPGTISTGTRRYDGYTFMNCATTPSCVTITLNSACSTADKALFAAAYLGSFNPNDICANYLADPGLNPGATPVNFSFTVPAGASFTVVVSEVNSGAGTNCGYTLNLAGLCCSSSDAACPTVSQLAPATGVPGSNLMVAGANLGNVTSVKFAGDTVAAFHVVNNSTLNIVIPNGASNGPLKLGSPGCPDAQTVNFASPANLGTNNEIVVDDGTMEVISNLVSAGQSYFVNRLTPAVYPVTLTKVAIFFPGNPAAPPSGTPFEVLTGANPGGGTNIDGIKFTATSYLTQPGGTFSIYNVPPLTITSGDFVVGFRIPFVSGVFPAAADVSSAARGRSYVSDNGSTFFVVPRNYGFRAAILQGCPNVTTVSPSSGAAGTQVILTGTNLNGVSAVKFLNNVTAQFTVNSPTQITTTVPPAALTGPITLSKSGCPDMTTPVFVVGACPTVASINPATGSPGAAVTITGTNFTDVSAVRFANNRPAQFTVNSATSITTTVPAGAITGPINISRPNCPDVQTANFTVTCPAINIAPATLPDSAVGVAYQQTLTASGGTAPYSFTVTAGALPGSLALSTGGTLSGAPAAAGTFSFTVTTTDATGCAGTRSYTVNISVTLGAQTRALYVLNDCNGCPNQIYGYAVNEATGALALLPGFPVPTGGNGGTGVFSERLTIDRANQRLYAINDSTDTVSAFAINPTTGALNALPYSPISLGSGAWNTVAVHPSGSPLVIGDGNSATRKLASFLITPTTANPALGSPFNLGSATAFSSAFSQDWKYIYVGGSAFNNQFAGFSVNTTTGVLTALDGSPFNAGATNPLAYATDVSGRLFMANFDAGQVRAFTTQDGVPSGVSGNPFSSGLSSANHGVLHPNGFYLVGERGSNIGVFQIGGSGNATTLSAVAGSPFNSGGVETDVLALNQAGTFLFAADGSSRNLKTFGINPTTGVLTLPGTQPANTAGASGRLNGMAYFAPPCETINLSPATLPNGVLGAAYNQIISASPAGSYNFSVTAGVLPAGLSLNATTGAITGTPTTVGTTNFTITALGLGPCSGSRAYALTVNNPTPLLSGLNPASATAGGASFTLTVNGSNFVNSSVVRWNNNDRVTTFVSGTQLTAAIPAGDITDAGTVNITVFNAAPGGGESGALSFRIALPEYEADVTPRPDGNGTVTTTDWVLVGRFAAGLDTPVPGGEFQRADCAPRGALGDGRLTVNDWVQAGRYAAGLDTVVLAGGPTEPVQFPIAARAECGLQSGDQKASSSCDPTSANPQSAIRPGHNPHSSLVRAAQESLSATGLLTVELDAQGGENALAFSLQFDPAQWRFVSARTGRDASEAALHINARDVAAGRVGVVLAMPAGKDLAAGSHQAVQLRFVPVVGRGLAGVISFADQPLRREVVNVNAESVPAEYSVRTEAFTARAAANVSAASFREGELSAESIASAFGLGLATATQAAETLPLPFDLAGTRVTVADSQGAERLAPLFFVSPGQVNYLIPADTAEGLATVTISSADGTTWIGVVRIALPAPGLFAANADGQGIASAIVLRQRADGSQQFEPVSHFDSALDRVTATPIDLGREDEQVFLTLFGTGLRHHNSRAIATIGGVPVEVVYIGPVPGYAGLDQCNLRLPRNLVGRGEVEIALAVESKAANSVKVVIN